MTVDLASAHTLIVSFLLVLFRTAGLVMTAPMLGGGIANVRTRLMVAVSLALILTPITPPPADTTIGVGLILQGLAQTAIGISMGLLLSLAFEALQLGAEAISAGAGLSFAQMVDPVRGMQATAMGALLMALAMLAFLAQDGHLAVVQLLADSFTQMPLGAPLPAQDVAGLVVGQGSVLFSGALKVALPAMIALLAVNLVLGVASRVAPALNIFSVGLPASVLAGLLALLLGIEALLNGWLSVMWESLRSVTQVWGQ
jgi:flagellar biosynthesis protein FliR